MPAPNGLIPVRFSKGAGNYFAGEIAGFTREIADDLARKGLVTFVDAEDDPGILPGTPAPAKQSAPAGDDGEDEGDDDGEVETGPAGEVVIPEGWNSLHGNARKSLAKKLAGAPVGSVDEADAVIAAELERRAAAS